MKIDRAISPGDLPLYVRAQGSDRMLQAGPSYRIGRDPDSDIVVDDPRVSWHHAVLRLDNNAWLLEDSGSTNGTFFGMDRVRQVPITGNTMVRLGHPEDGPALSCSLGLAASPPSAPAGHGDTKIAQQQPGQAPPAGAPPRQAPPQYPPAQSPAAASQSPPAQRPPLPGQYPPPAADYAPPGQSPPGQYGSQQAPPASYRQAGAPGQAPQIQAPIQAQPGQMPQAAYGVAN